MALVTMNLKTSSTRLGEGGGGVKKSDLMGKDFFRLCMG